MAVEEPRPGVVRLEPNRDVITRSGCARAYHVAPYGVDIIVLRATCAAYDGEDVLLKWMSGCHFSS